MNAINGCWLWLALVLLAGLDMEGFFGRHDLNRDGKISKDELKDAELFAALDGDKDGVIGLREIRGVARYLTPDIVRRLVDAKAAWQRILDGADPAVYDRDADGALQPRELTLMLFDQLDVDRNDRLDDDELALLPYDFSTTLRAKTKRQVSRNDLVIPRDAFLELDLDRDGKITRDEFPWPRPVPFVPVLVRDLNEYWRTVDRDQNGKLDKRELPREDLFRALDAKSMGYITLGTLKSQRGEDLFDTARRSEDRFLTRYDLNGDGVVSADEFPGPRAFFARIDQNGDGKYDKADRAGVKDPPAPVIKASKKWGRG